ncbi:MAG: hypothetical protein IH621_04605 [Krumholzibacteria bacterium]|nr:hypothetical protein [Candidatus Krumholzibacteria bacterium]
MELYRPTGMRELQLVLTSDLAAWPPRLPDQPIFYPVLNLYYATQIAQKWNTKSEERAGYVTAFVVEDEFASRYDRHVVGDRIHEELWVPASELEEFNRHIRGPIRVVGAFYGYGFTGLVPKAGSLKGLDATQQLSSLEGIFDYSLQDFHGEITMNRDAIFLHLPFWRAAGTLPGDRAAARPDVLSAIEDVWKQGFPDLPLPSSVGQGGVVLDDQ